MASTIKDVAKQAGVGVGTVSRVINGSSLVSQETRARVHAAIQELNYVPNTFARRLSLGKTLTIGVIAPWFTRPSVVERLRGIEQIISGTQYDLNIFNLETLERRKRCFSDLVGHGKVDGLLLVSVMPTEDEAHQLKDANIMTVQIDSRGHFFSQVAIDDIKGGFDATNHLISKGHKRIGFVSDIFSNSLGNNSQILRYVGYKQALEAIGLPLIPDYIQQCKQGSRAAKQVGERMLTLAEPPTAIFAASDTQAFGIMEAAQDLGVRIPEELSIIGYDDIEISTYLNLTTIHQPLLESGLQGTKLLLEELRLGSSMLKKVILPTRVIERGSTGPPVDSQT